MKVDQLQQPRQPGTFEGVDAHGETPLLAVAFACCWAKPSAGEGVRVVWSRVRSWPLHTTLLAAGHRPGLQGSFVRAYVRLLGLVAAARSSRRDPSHAISPRIHATESRA